MRPKRTSVVAGFLCGAMLAPPTLAEEVARRWRVGLGIGSFAAQDAERSDAANTLRVVDDTLIPVAIFTDPRQDSVFVGELEIQPGPVGNVSVWFGLSKIFEIEGSLGYSSVDLGDVEMQVQFDNDVSNPGFGQFNFRAYRIPVGTLELIPIQLSGVARFRPRARFNPFVGAGLGYQFASYEASSELRQLSANMSGSTGVQAELVPAVPGLPPTISVPNSLPRDLEGAVVETPDSWTWHVLGGAEYSWSRQWALAFEVRHVWAAESIFIGFDGQEDLGIAVPQTTVRTDSPLADGIYGPVRIRSGGLIDGGSLVPGPGRPEDTNCAEIPIFCRFDPTRKDGIPDPGLYYVDGGTLDYRAFVFSLGLRYTFGGAER